MIRVVRFLLPVGMTFLCMAGCSRQLHTNGRSAYWYQYPVESLCDIPRSLTAYGTVELSHNGERYRFLFDVIRNAQGFELGVHHPAAGNVAFFSRHGDTVEGIAEGTRFRFHRREMFPSIPGTGTVPVIFDEFERIVSGVLPMHNCRALMDSLRQRRVSERKLPPLQYDQGTLQVFLTRRERMEEVRVCTDDCVITYSGFRGEKPRKIRVRMDKQNYFSISYTRYTTE